VARFESLGAFLAHVSEEAAFQLSDRSAGTAVHAVLRALAGWDCEACGDREPDRNAHSAKCAYALGL
jgi:hypothetical protein